MRTGWHGTVGATEHVLALCPERGAASPTGCAPNLVEPQASRTVNPDSCRGSEDPRSERTGGAVGLCEQAREQGFVAGESGLGTWPALLWGMGAVMAFHLAYEVAELRSVVVIFVFCLGQLFRLQSMRWAFRAGLAIGLACYAPHLGFFWTIFGPAGAVLWLVLAVWLGVFLVLGRGVRVQWSGVAAAVLLPFLWTGLEYFRSELYSLRFSWLSAGYAFAEPDGSRGWAPWGVYGVGFVVAALAGCALLLESWFQGSSQSSRTTHRGHEARSPEVGTPGPGRPDDAVRQAGGGGRARPRVPTWCGWLLPRKQAGRDSEEDSRAGLRVAPETSGSETASCGTLGEVAPPFVRNGVPEWVEGFTEGSDRGSRGGRRVGWRASRGRWAAIGCLGLTTIFLGIVLGHSVNTSPSTASANGVRVVGVQLEYPDDALLLARLELAAREQPLAELVVLSEYTLQGPPTDALRSWCRRHRKHLVVGGRDPVSDSQFYNTVFVVDPQGEIVFRQVKSVPIQFFQDGLPARSQSLWESSWGRIGFAVCYDLSYRRVVDRLVRQGAEALIVPTADDSSWGEYEHRLHARVALVRAAEYGVPILRVAGSGISQLVDGTGRLVASAPYPGQGETLTGVLPMRRRGRVPFDSWLAPASTGVAGLVGLLLVVGGIRAQGWRVAVKGEG